MSAAAVSLTTQSTEQGSASSNGAAPPAAKSTKAKAGAIKKVRMLSEQLALRPLSDSPGGALEAVILVPV